jgi:hypothetical protein
MEDLARSAEKVATLMRLMTTTGGLRLKYRITAGAGAMDPDGFERRDIYVECKGPDADLMLQNDGELLRSLEHVAAKMLRLDAGSLKENNLADFVGIDLTHVSLLPWSQETLLANIVYSMSPAAIRNVVVGGRKIVAEGQLLTQDTQVLFRNIQQLRKQWM